MNIQPNVENKRKRVLIVDDEESVLSTLKRLFRNHPYEVRITTRAVEALEMLAHESADLIISDMRMPEMDGAEFLALAKERFPLTERILLTGYSDMESTVKAINDGGIFGYISKPWNVNSLLALVESALDQTHKNRLKNRTLKRFKRSNDDLTQNIERSQRELAQSAEFVGHAFQRLNDIQTETEQLLINLLELKYPGSREVSQNVKNLAGQMCELLNLSDEETQTLKSAAALHAIGKLGLPEIIAKKKQVELNKQELASYQTYPSLGATMLMAHSQFEDVGHLILEHKECADGSGYPKALKLSQISKLGRLLGLLVDYAELRAGFITGNVLSHDQSMLVIEENSYRYDSSFIPSIGSLTLEIDAVDDETDMLLPLFSLREGMVLTQDVLSETKVLLLPKGVELTEALIGNLLTIERNSDQKLLVSVRFPKK